jgi:phosphate starvation-inducible membrane PsiE
MQIFALLGLTLVIVAWIMQLLSTIKGSKSIQPQFVLFYLIGVICLVIDGFSAGLNDVAFLNIVCLLVSFAVFIRLISIDHEHPKAIVVKTKSKRKKK